ERVRLVGGQARATVMIAQLVELGGEAGNFAGAAGHPPERERGFDARQAGFRLLRRAKETQSRGAWPNSPFSLSATNKDSWSLRPRSCARTATRFSRREARQSCSPSAACRSPK